MMTGRNRFNLYLLALSAVLICGCQSTTKDKDGKEVEKKPVATLHLHLEVANEPMGFSTSVPVFRSKPVMVTVDKSPFLTEANVSEASILPGNGGFALQIKFDKRGTWLLENYSTTNPDKRLVIFSTFGPGLKESRWLAAPVMHKRIADGLLVFTPDATREEADEIVLGLNAVAKEVAAKSNQW